MFIRRSQLNCWEMLWDNTRIVLDFSSMAFQEKYSKDCNLSKRLVYLGWSLYTHLSKFTKSGIFLSNWIFHHFGCKYLYDLLWVISLGLLRENSRKRVMQHSFYFHYFKVAPKWIKKPPYEDLELATWPHKNSLGLHVGIHQPSLLWNFFLFCCTSPSSFNTNCIP